MWLFSWFSGARQTKFCDNHSATAIIKLFIHALLTDTCWQIADYLPETKLNFRVTAALTRLVGLGYSREKKFRQTVMQQTCKHQQTASYLSAQ